MALEFLSNTLIMRPYTMRLIQKYSSGNAGTNDSASGMRKIKELYYETKRGLVHL